MGRGVTTVAAVSVVTAVAFAGYATGSVGVVTGAVDNALVRSEKPRPKPKPWEKAQPRQKAAPDASDAFQERVSAAGKARSEPANNSDFEQVLERRAAAAAAEDSELRDRLGKSDQAAPESSDDAFRARVESESDQATKPAAKDFSSRVGAKPKKSNKRKKRPFEKRVMGSTQ